MRSPLHARSHPLTCHSAKTTELIQLLALHILFRLIKKSGIAGMPGSEYRTLLCCLALANKCLEDNTYTARTWSDVAGLPVEAINFGCVALCTFAEISHFYREREILKALEWKVQPGRDEWIEFQDRVEKWKWRRQEALASPQSMSTPVVFDPSYSMGGPSFHSASLSRSQPTSPLRVALDFPAPKLQRSSISVEHPSEHINRKRKADEADLVVPGHHPAPALRRASAGALAQQHPRANPLFQSALQQGYLRSASLSPISSYGPFSPLSAISPGSTPYSTPPSVFSPITYGVLTDRGISPAIPAMGSAIWTTTLTTDPTTGRITTRLIPLPQGFGNVMATSNFVPNESVNPLY